MEKDPALTNPNLYRVMENDRVRVLEYHDRPGDRTTDHAHPDSVMVTLSSFRRRLVGGDTLTEVELEAGTVRWLPAQSQSGENIGDTESRVIFVEVAGCPGKPPIDVSRSKGSAAAPRLIALRNGPPDFLPSIHLPRR